MGKCLQWGRLKRTPERLSLKSTTLRLEEITSMMHRRRRGCWWEELPWDVLSMKKPTLQKNCGNFNFRLGFDDFIHRTK
jgi:hypothetical protein